MEMVEFFEKVSGLVVVWILGGARATWYKNLVQTLKKRLDRAGCDSGSLPETHNDTVG